MHKLLFKNASCVYLFWPCQAFTAAHIAFASQRAGPPSVCRAWASYRGSCPAAEHRLHSRASAAVMLGLSRPLYVGSSCPRAQVSVPYFGRQILNHWAIGETSHTPFEYTLKPGNTVIIFLKLLTCLHLTLDI